MSDSIEYKSNNGYTGRMYGESSLSIFETESGKEVFHTGFRNCNNLENLQELVEGFPTFMRLLNEHLYGDAQRPHIKEREGYKFAEILAQIAFERQESKK